MGRAADARCINKAATSRHLELNLHGKHSGSSASVEHPSQNYPTREMELGYLYTNCHQSLDEVVPERH